MEEILLEGLVAADHAREANMFKAPPTAPAQQEDAKGQRYEDGTDSEGNVTKQPIKTIDTKWTRAQNFTFYWLAEELGVKDLRFDVHFVEKVHYKLEYLKHQFDEVEVTTSLINKRETLLGVKPTEFKALTQIQEDLKPLFELWEVTKAFAKQVPSWVEGKFDVLDPTVVEIKTEEWQTELKRLQKTTVVTHAKQLELLQFMLDAINLLKTYFPMIRTLRTKGLVKRHWKMVGKKLRIDLDPAKNTLHRLIAYELNAPENLKVIKQVCEVATKEYAVMQQLTQLEKEIKSHEFKFELLPDQVTLIVVQLAELISAFEEFFLRIGVLKTNPNIKNFVDKLMELEKVIKAVIDQINEWAELQRNFIYLFGIFNQMEMRNNLPTESKMFYGIKNLFETTTAMFKENMHVYKINQKEGFLALLQKANRECEFIRVALRSYLEKKRGQFPRLFFLSNEELIDIFGKGNDLVKTMLNGDNQAFVTTLFEGVHRMVFNKQTHTITHMKSKEGEVVKLGREIKTNTNIDNWLMSFEAEMINCNKDYFFHAYRTQGDSSIEDWIMSNPGQSCYLAS
jgi:dynein heavy chain, axonemal